MSVNVALAVLIVARPSWNKSMGQITRLHSGSVGFAGNDVKLEPVAFHVVQFRVRVCVVF